MATTCSNPYCPCDPCDCDPCDCRIDAPAFTGVADAPALPPSDDTRLQPAWLGERFPAYVAESGGMAHDVASIRTAEHAGHRIEVRTAYTISIDGKPVHLHAAVDNDGNLQCHAAPYESFASAIDLVQTLIDRYPAAFGALPSEHDHAQT